jgi:seryl-tRNA synthetase
VFPRLIPTQALDSFQLTQYTPELLLTVPDSPNRILDPVQCVSFYHHLRGSNIEPERLPLKIVEALGGWTWRNESPDRLDGPYRAKEFARVEHVYVGTPEQVREARRQVTAALTGLLTELGLGWQVVVGSGCMDIPSVIAARNAARGPDDIPVQDIEVPIRGALAVPLPSAERVSGKHDEFEDGRLVSMPNSSFYLDTDELCGCSVEGDHLVASFGVTAGDSGPLWSGCCGIGLNRLVVGFLYQHGFDPNNWPAWVTERWAMPHRD